MFPDDASPPPPPEVGGGTLRGKELPFRLADSELVLLPPPELLVSFLFILLIKSLTEDFFGPLPDDFSSFLDLFVVSSLLSLTTDVISPDFLSTPTIDQGRGLGKGLGLGPKLSTNGGEPLSWDPPAENVEALSPTMDPPPPLVGVEDVVVIEAGEVLDSDLELLLEEEVESSVAAGNSLVGDVKLLANPVDL